MTRSVNEAIDPNESLVLGRLLDTQKQAHLRDPIPTVQVRKDRLNRLADLLKTHNVRLQEAMSEDYGHRCHAFSELADIAMPYDAISHARRHLKSWMKPSRRRLEFPLGWLGAAGRVEYQPKGCVGIMSPWNFPVNLTVIPLSGVLAAGNRAMIKPSELTPVTSGLMAQLINQYFDIDEVHVVTGGVEIGTQFSALPFDHLVFTGSTAVGRHVMRAAAENLVPLTLELGGKSPAIIGASANLAKAATAIMYGKLLNSGQVCIAPDYVLLAKSDHEAFVKHAIAAATKMYSNGLLLNQEYTSVLGQRNYDRLQAYIEDAQAKGAQIISINPTVENDANQHQCKFPPTLIVGADDSMKVMQEEIFGPILPIRMVDSTTEAIDYVNTNPHPLALYFFGESVKEQRQVIERTTSGGVTVNDTIIHKSQETLPFGGVGASGMGRYHGHEGFLEFSHHKSVFKQMPYDLLSFLRPPYGRMFKLYCQYLLKR